MMDVSFCLAALRGSGEVRQAGDSNTDQVSRFTSAAFTAALAEAGVAISMDSRGRRMFIDRLWRSLKYEDV